MTESNQVPASEPERSSDAPILAWAALVERTLPTVFPQTVADPTDELRSIGAELHCEFIGFRIYMATAEPVIDLVYKHATWGQSLPGSVLLTPVALSEIGALRWWVSLSLCRLIAKAEKQVAGGKS